MSVNDEQGGISRRGFVGAAGAAAITTPALAFAGKSGTPIYRIHPAIGIARVGNADPSTFFIGPEAPGYGPLGEAPGTPAPPYKAADGRVKPQGARFRIYEYAMVNGRQMPVREVTLDTPGVTAIRWSVHLANKKASFYKFEGRAGEIGPPGGLRNASVSSRASLEIDFGARTISGRSQSPVEFRAGSAQQISCPLDAAGKPVIDYLGQVRTDASGRLIVVGGQGRANYSTATAPTLDSYANNDGWFDDISDGPITAVLSVTGVGDVAIDARGGAWVLCPPPDFAPQIRGAVTAYDLLFDLGVRSIPIPHDSGLYDDGGPLGRLRRMKADFKSGADFELPDIVPDFTTDIQPILLSGYNYWWVDGQVTSKHNSLIDPNLANPDPAYTNDRQGVLIYLRPPLGVNQPNGNRSMPHLLGDDPYTGSTPDAIRHLSLTHMQYALMRNWANNQFTPPSGSPPPPPTISAHGLDRAALENASGGAFFPGIEFSWQMRNPALFAEPFRLSLAANSGYWGETRTISPGHFSRQLALPWHADFNDCADEGDFGWWPSQRPTAVLTDPSASKRVDWARPDVKFDSGSQTSTHTDMVACWYKFGFVIASGDLFVETERATHVP